MARRRRRLTIAEIVQRAIDRLSIRYRPEPLPKPEPDRPSARDILNTLSPKMPPTVPTPGGTRRPPYPGEIQVPLAEREYHVILDGYGPGWFRPSIADEANPEARKAALIRDDLS